MKIMLVASYISKIMLTPFFISKSNFSIFLNRLRIIVCALLLQMSIIITFIKKRPRIKK